jgi:hypothetical protein
VLVFVLVTAGAVAVAAAFVAWAALKSDAPEPVRPASSDLKLATANKHYLVFQHVARDSHYAEVAIASLERPGDAPTYTGLVCERVYASAGRGVCLVPKQEPLGSAVNARVFDQEFRPEGSVRLDGIASRTRVSPDGRYGAATTFVAGHSYKDTGFSTNTSLIDLEQGKVVGDLEKFDITRNGKPFEAIDFNFWGVTFAPDSRTFYATLQSSGDIYLIEGDVEKQTARVIAPDVECPSLSPDGRQIAFKHREGTRWRLHVLDLASGHRTPLAEKRSIDDQVEWLDASHILYGYLGDVWVVPADGGGQPAIYLRDALSPAVVRS